MRNAIFYAGLVLCIIAAVGVTLKKNADLHELQKRQANGIAAIDKLAYQTIMLREQILSNRTGLAGNYDALAEAAYLSDAALTDLEKQLEGNTATKNKLSTLRSALITQLDATEGFKRYNSVLRNSERYLPLLGRQLAPALAEAGYTQEALSLTKIVEVAQDYVKVSSVINADQLLAYQKELDVIFAYLHGLTKEQAVEFSTHFAKLIKVKRNTDYSMNRALNSGILEITEALHADIQSHEVFGSPQSHIVTYASLALAILAFVLLTAWITLNTARERYYIHQISEFQTITKAHIKASHLMMDYLEDHISDVEETLNLTETILAMPESLDKPPQTDSEKTARLLDDLASAHKRLKSGNLDNNRKALQDLRDHILKSKQALQRNALQ